jgi:hypothetical protein
MIEELNNVDNFFKYRYLLVDNLVSLYQGDPLSKQGLLELYGENKAFGEKKLTQVSRPDFAYDQDFSPTLVKLADPDEFLENPILDRISKQTAIECLHSNRYICGYLVTDLKPSMLANLLIDVGNNIAKTLHRTYYPFFEPFRMQFLQEIASNEDNAWLKAQLSQIDNYYYPSIYGGQFIHFTADNAAYPPESWSENYGQRLKNFIMIRTLVNAWANNRMRFNEQKSLPLAQNVIMQSTQLVEQAYQLGLTDATDTLFWGLNGLRFQTAFTQSPKVLEQIPKAQKEPGSLSKHIIKANINLESQSTSFEESQK